MFVMKFVVCFNYYSIVIILCVYMKMYLYIYIEGGEVGRDFCFWKFFCFKGYRFYYIRYKFKVVI